MAMIVKTDYTDAVKNVLRTVEGPLSVQPLFNVVIHNPKTNRVSLLTVGEDDGEDIFEKPIIIGFTETGKICIEKNHTDLDLEGELLKKGVPGEDIVRKEWPGLQNPLP
ncbi:MAG TPA: element excision factor XisI family protein [Cytophagales bacterium]